MIAISYRREDSQPVAGRLYDRLQARFGKQNVFMDFDSIPPGVDFREQIKRTIERSNLVIAVIGPRWLGEQSDSSRRIDDPADFVRLEIKYALEKGIPVIPLLVDNTLMPKPEKLPPELEALAFRNALPLDSGIDFHTHAERLITGICGLMGSGGTPEWANAVVLPTHTQRSKIPVWGALAFTIAVGVALFAWFSASKRSEETDKIQQALATPPTAPTIAPHPTAAATASIQASVAAQDTPPSATASSRVEVTSSITKDTVREFVKTFVSANQSYPPDAAVALYAPKVQYRGEGERDPGYIRKDLEKDHKRWPIRRDSIESDIKIDENVPGRDYRAKYNLKFYVESKERREWVQGQVAVDLSVMVTEDVLKISAVNETVLQRETGEFPGDQKPNKVSPTPGVMSAQHSSPPSSSKVDRLFVGTWEGTAYYYTAGNGQTNYGPWRFRLIINDNGEVANISSFEGKLDAVERKTVKWNQTNSRTLVDSTSNGTTSITVSSDGRSVAYRSGVVGAVTQGTLYKKE